MPTQARAFLPLALLASPPNALAQPRAAGAGEQHFRTGLEACGRREFRAARRSFARPTSSPASRCCSSTWASRLPLAGLVGGGAGVVAAGVGLGLYLDVGARFDRCVAARCPEAERARGEDLAAVTLLWGGGVLAAAGLVTFLAAPRGTHATARAMVVPQPRGLAVVGTF